MSLFKSSFKLGGGFTTIVSTVFLSSLLLFIKNKVQRIQKKKQRRIEWDGAGKGIVVLHQFGRGKFCPNLSPFALKLETFMRLAGIEYVVDTGAPFGPKGKCPWITLDGIDTADSEFIVKRLQKEFNTNLDRHLSSAKEKAAADMAKVLVEERLFWCVITWRYLLDQCESFLKSQPESMFPPVRKAIFTKVLGKSIKKRSKAQGIGVHSKEEIFEITRDALSSLSDYLGDSTYFGGSKPCTADCAIFGGLSQLMWNAPESKYGELVQVTFPNLARYCTTMKDELFPDWDSLLHK